ncbi:hypothetical protein BH20ACT2_BH20ACT2_24990 [soil metagenome]
MTDRQEALPRERGQVLMLMPAAVLVVIILGAIAVDLSVVYLAERDLSAAAAAAANDAVTYGFDEEAYRRGEGYVIDPRRVDEAVTRSLQRRDIDARPSVRIDGDEVEVTLAGTAEYVFAKAIPGVGDGTDLTVVGSARTEEDVLP